MWKGLPEAERKAWEWSINIDLLEKQMEGKSKEGMVDAVLDIVKERM